MAHVAVSSANLDSGRQPKSGKNGRDDLPVFLGCVEIRAVGRSEVGVDAASDQHLAVKKQR